MEFRALSYLMNRFLALCGASFGFVAFVFASIALFWDSETKVDYFRASTQYSQLSLARIMSIVSLIFTSIGAFSSLLMIIK